MSRLNKRALYQMATGNDNSTPHPQAPKPPCSKAQDTANLVETELTLEMVDLKPLSGRDMTQVLNGRLSGRLQISSVQAVEAGDAISVSPRAQRNGNSVTDGYEKREVLQKLGSGGLGLLANAFVEQLVMTDEEVHSVQQRFYGLQAV